MNEICIPLETSTECLSADVEVRLHNNNKEIHFRLECLKLDREDNSEQRIVKIRDFINTYSTRWELLQILDTPEDCNYVQLLYREHS